MMPSGFENHNGAGGIGVVTGSRVLKGASNCGYRSKVHDGCNFTDEIGDQRLIEHASSVDLDTRDPTQIGFEARRKVIEHQDSTCLSIAPQ